MAKRHKSEIVAKTTEGIGQIVLAPAGEDEVDTERIYKESIAMHHAVERAVIEGVLPKAVADTFTRSSITKLQYCVELEKGPTVEIVQQDDD